jgi:hypothetical protein
MKRTVTGLVLAACVAAFAACGGGGDDGPPGTRVEPRGVPFTFVVPDDFRGRRVRASFSRGSKPLAVYALDPWNLVDVRRSAPRAIPLDRVAAQIGGSLKGLGFPGLAGTREKHGDREYVVFRVVNQIGGRRTTSRLYFFTGGGATWEIECQSTDDKAKQVADACDGVVSSVEFR